jgi:hypothetical protein
MMMKEMMSMKTKGQPGAAPISDSPLILALFKSFSYIPCFSAAPHEIAQGVIYMVGFRSRSGTMLMTLSSASWLFTFTSSSHVLCFLVKMV